MGVHLGGMICWSHVLTSAFMKGLSFFVAGMSGFKAEFFSQVHESLCSFC